MKFKLAILALFFFLAPARSEEATVMFYNLCNYFVDGDYGGNPKADFSKDALVKMIKEAAPDILVVTEMGSAESLRDLMAQLAQAGCKYKFSKICNAYDKNRHLALISKTDPETFECKMDLSYKIKPKDKPNSPPEEYHVERGFLHAVFKFPSGYSLHVVGAHLKSKLLHPRYNQTDMRRYEARLLKYYVNELQEKNTGANIIVFGDMNDSCDSDPMVTLRLGGKPDKKLYDLRPVDAKNAAWTHWWNQDDSYSRIDYAYSNYGLLPEIVFSKNCIPHIPGLWMFASDHRPVKITLRTEDQPPQDQKTIEKLFTNEIYRGGK